MARNRTSGSGTRCRTGRISSHLARTPHAGPRTGFSNGYVLPAEARKCRSSYRAPLAHSIPSHTFSKPVQRGKDKGKAESMFQSWTCHGATLVQLSWCVKLLHKHRSRASPFTGKQPATSSERRSQLLTKSPGIHLSNSPQLPVAVASQAQVAYASKCRVGTNPSPLAPNNSKTAPIKLATALEGAQPTF